MFRHEKNTFKHPLGTREDQCCLNWVWSFCWILERSGTNLIWHFLRLEITHENQDEWIRCRKDKSITAVKSNFSQVIVSFHQQIISTGSKRVERWLKLSAQWDIWLKRLKRKSGLVWGPFRSEWRSSDLSDYRRSGKRVCHSEWTARNEKLAGMCCVRGRSPAIWWAEEERKQPGRNKWALKFGLQQLHNQDQDSAKKQKTVCQRRLSQEKMLC